jgi:hypothetical protein
VWLKGLESEIQSDVVITGNPARSEAAILVGNVTELSAHVDLGAIGVRQPMPHVCEVSRSSDPTTPGQPPILIICRDDLGENWVLGGSEPSALQLLFGRALTELVWHLLMGKVDSTGLQSKVVSIIGRLLD